MPHKIRRRYGEKSERRELFTVFAPSAVKMIVKILILCKNIGYKNLDFVL